MTRCSPSNVRTVCKGLDHPEGLTLDANGTIYAGGERGQIYQVDEASASARQIAKTGGFVLGLCADSSGALYACDAGRNEVLRISGRGVVETVSSGSLDNPNDCALDGDGNLFFSESGEYRLDRASGRLHVVTQQGQCKCIHPGPFRFANGVFVDASQSLLYVIESTGPAILAFRTDGPQLASLTPVREITLEPDSVPDGLACSWLSTLPTRSA